MKYLAILFFLFALTSSTLKKEPRSTDRLGQLVFEMVQSGDWSDLEDVLLTEKQYKGLITEMSESAKFKTHLLEKASKRIHRRDIAVPTSFQHVRRKGARSGVNWEKAMYQKTIAKLRTDSHGNENCSLEVSFFYNSNSYKIWVTDCVKADGNWVVAFRKIRWLGAE